MFDYLFVSYENRSNYEYRQIGFDPSKSPTTGISEPTYFARVSYVSGVNVDAELSRAQSLGVNLIRIAVEPAMIKASVTYIDPADGLSYPSDFTMLDSIIAKASALGIVTQLQNGNDKVPLSTNINFVKFLAARYAENPYVWINPANELNGANGSGNVNNISVWHSTMSQYIATIRAEGFLNPVVINPPQFGENLIGIVSTLNANTVYSADSSLIIGIHLYPQLGQYDFLTTRLPAETTNWFQFVNSFCVFVDEVGINNYGTSYDPDLNPGYPSANLDEWARMRSWTIDFCNWAYQQCNHGNLNGVTGISWYAYIPGMAIVDLNSMVRLDQSLSAWGQIFSIYFSSKPDYVQPEPEEEQWNSYTPTVYPGWGVGTFTATGRFFKLNPKTVLIQIYVTVLNKGSSGGVLFVSLPDNVGLPVNASQSLSGMQIVNDFSLTVRASEGANALRVKRYDGAYPGDTGAQMILSGHYEIMGT